MASAAFRAFALVARREDHLVVALGELAGGLEADPAVCACDQSDGHEPRACGGRRAAMATKPGPGAGSARDLKANLTQSCQGW